jgi:putative endonuclease
VVDWLAEHGWQVLARRVRSEAGELDIVAIDPEGMLVAVEVRARSSLRTGGPAASLSPAGVRRRRAALAAYATKAPPHRGLRLDLVAAVPLGDRWRLSRLPGIEVP